MVSERLSSSHYSTDMAATPLPSPREGIACHSPRLGSILTHTQRRKYSYLSYSNCGLQAVVVNMDPTTHPLLALLEFPAATGFEGQGD